MKFQYKKAFVATALLIFGSGILLWSVVPQPLFNSPTSTLLFSRESRLLSAIIAQDGQWRFPVSDSVPHKFAKALLAFEDQYFYYHFGVNPFSIGRAFQQNIRAEKVVSGGSTLTMQLARMALTDQHGNRSRSVWHKLTEAFLALGLELRFSKEKLLTLYTANAPFGGNVVGLEAAAWRYFGRSPQQLSWGEIATLAVLPNAPSLIYPGKNQVRLKAKRNRLLQKLWKLGELDSLSAALAQLEPLPQHPFPLPQKGFHLLTRAMNEGKTGQNIHSSINASLQEQVRQKAQQHQRQMARNEIHNLAVLVVDVRTNEAIAYLGNAPNLSEAHSPLVDIIRSPRSTGSILKPFLFAAAQQEGLLLPKMLLPDVPTQIAGYAPENFDRSFRGAVPADKALAWSLNIPAVRLLRSYTYNAFLSKLRKLGISTMPQPGDHYGLTLILGGAEANLWELTSLYAGMARTVSLYTENSSRYFDKVSFAFPSYLKKQKAASAEKNGSEHTQLLSAGASWATLEALTEVTRPTEEQGWRQFGSAQKLAWKTGTSFGHRDAWAIGVTPDYAVGVWVGNADGEGRPGLVGTQAAAPLLFEVARLLPQKGWFETPFDDLESIEVCRESGYRAGMYCPNPDSALVAVGSLEGKPCPYHRLIQLDPKTELRVTANCRPVSEMETLKWFVLPPLQEWYFKKHHPEYRSLPPFAPGCVPVGTTNMALIYPHHLTTIFLPKEMDGTLGKVVFEATHRKADEELFWHIDNAFVGVTKSYHKQAVQLPTGEHVLTLVDRSGEVLTRKFRIVKRER